MVSQIRECRRKLSRQRRLACLSHALNAGSDAASSFGNLFVAGARNPFLKIHQPRLGEYRMSMRIDEARQDHAPTAINLDDLLAILLQPWIAQRVFRCPDRNDLPAQTEDGRVMNNSKLGKGSAASRSSHC